MPSRFADNEGPGSRPDDHKICPFVEIEQAPIKICNAVKVSTFEPAVYWVDEPGELLFLVFPEVYPHVRSPSPWPTSVAKGWKIRNT